MLLNLLFIDPLVLVILLGNLMTLRGNICAGVGLKGILRIV